MRIIVILVLVVTILKVSGASVYTVPEVTFEALKGGGFRAYIPDTNSATFFALHANLNKEIVPQEPGQINDETRTATNGYLILNFPNKLKVNDVLHYWIFISANRGGYQQKLLTWTVKSLVDSYEDLVGCATSVTIINGASNQCVGKLAFSDDFRTPTLNEKKWLVEHRIPTYVGPNYEFNSYENRPDTCFTRNRTLFLKPIALNEENEVRGELNLTVGCTSSNENECYYKHGSAFLLPPVKSAKIQSKFSFRYGKVKIRAKLPSGDWIFPLLHLEPKTKSTQEDPTAVIIGFSRGNNYLRSFDMRGINDGDIGSRLLTAGPIVHSIEPLRSQYLHSVAHPNPLSDDFHIYTLDWTPGRMIFSVDDQEIGIASLRSNLLNPTVGVTSEAPFDKEYILTLGVAVGGLNDFPDGYNPDYGEKPWSNEERNYIKKFFDARSQWLKTWVDDNTALKVDYVKVFTI